VFRRRGSPVARACAEATVKPCIDRLDMIRFAAAKANELCSFEILE
jgi:hypothetical protein